ncbi:GlcG/HbpS family heme-binding protein [Actinomadura oligospora]|uniref:GlcG/HbpS family heme-binding protein n=1 Tax=Actinomadura oligospora TaxID=111804 RepID=UPI0004B98F8D|nr:heme-binding protein [Actinomadura oligospora]
MSLRHVAAGVVALGAVASVTLPLSGNASAQAPARQAPAAKVRAGHPVDEVLSNASLERASRAAVRSAEGRGQRVTVVVMERSGVIRLVVRMRQAGPQTYESAKRKAYTAVAFGQPTSALAGNATIRQIPGTLTLAGGVPVKRNGFPIAGVGVGGAPDGRIDEQIARDVRDAINR